MPAGEGTYQGLTEIVVTARKRSEPLQEVPMSINVIGEEQITRRGAQSLQDIAVAVPSLSFRTAGPGRQKLSLRGISSSAGIAPTVSFYVDETPLASISSAANTSFQQANADPNLFDIARIEVLRGPQGTLYGASSLGGTVRLITHEPNLDQFEARLNSELSETHEGDLNWALRGLVNLPLMQDRLALRVTGATIQNDGFIDRLVGNYDATGHINGPLSTDVVLPTRQLPAGARPLRIRDVNNEDIDSARAVLRFEATDSFYLQPSVFWQRTTQDGKTSYDNGPGRLDQRRPFDVPEPYDDELMLSNLTAGYDFSLASLLSTSSYMDRDIDNHEDFTDGMSFFFGYANGPEDLPAQRLLDATGEIWDLTAAPFPASVVPIAAPLSEVVHLQDFTQELRLTSTTQGRFDWIVGAYYKSFRSRAGYGLAVPGYGAAFPAFAIATGGVFNDIFASVQSITDYRELAAFGEIGYAFAAHWKLTLGARWFDYESDFARTTQGLFFGQPFPGTVETRASSTAINPKVVLSYEPRDDVQLYGTAAKGYRPGATNAPVPVGRCDADLAALGLTAAPENYEPDSLWNYEVGVKSQLSRRLTVNAAAYFIDWSDIQQKIFLPTCGALFTDNAGTARSKGAELDLDALLTDNLRVSAGAAYNEAEFTESVPFAGVRSGDRLTDAPEWTLNATVEYAFARLWGGEQYVRVGWSFVDTSLDTQDLTNALTGVRTPGIAKDSFDIADLRIGFTSASWEVAVFVKNVFDERAQFTQVDTLAQLIPSFSRVVTNRPRTVGISATYGF